MQSLLKDPGAVALDHTAPPIPRRGPLGRLEPRWVRLWLLTGLCVLVGLAWAPGLSAPYQYDDYITPLKDPASQSLDQWLEALPRTLRPLTKLTFAVESSLGITEAPERRVFNFIIFLLSAVFLALLVEAAGLSPWPATVLATLWAVHPVHAELLLALAGRSALLALAFTLASAWCLTQEKSRWALGLALLAVLARETAWPWLVVAAGLVGVGESRRPRFALPLLAGGIGGVMVLSSSRLRELLCFSWSDSGALNRLGLQWAALPRGTWMLFFEPNAFSVDIELSPLGWLRFAFIVGAAVMYGAALWLVLRPGQPRCLRLGALLWLSLVVPLHSLVPKLDPLTARSFSASGAALMVIFAGAFGPVWVRRPDLRRYAFGLGLVLVLALVPASRGRAQLYQDPITLWGDAAARAPTRTRPLINQGTLLAQKGRLTEARSTMAEAVRRDRRSTEARERLNAIETLIETRQLLEENRR